METLNCRFCGKECKNKNSLRNHERLCKLNPNRCNVIRQGFNNLGKKSWNRGLSKETDSRVAKNSLSVRNTIAVKKQAGWKPYRTTSSYWTDERKKERSEMKKRYYAEHPDKHPNRLLASNKNHMTYPERLVSEWLIMKGIEFENQYFTKVNDKNRFVDFYLTGLNLYIEVDGLSWHKDCKELDKEKDLYAKNAQHIDTLRIDASKNVAEQLEKYL